jgi:predicted metalloprotease with PDZ domain
MRKISVCVLLLLVAALLHVVMEIRGAEGPSVDVEMPPYTKGQILGTLLDLELRERTGTKKSLDDVIRQLLAEHGLPATRALRDAWLKLGL